MAIKLSISLPEDTVAKLDQETRLLQSKNLGKYVSCSAVINAHLKRSLDIPLEVNI